MAEAYCTCGAKLPEDARFCHKCGKPQFEEVPIRSAEETAVEVPLTPAAAAPTAPPPVSFRNTAAVRVGMWVSFLVALLLSVPLPAAFHALWQIVVLVAAGFFSVYLYRRRTGLFLSVRDGARMGWITGIFCFLIILIVFTISIAAAGIGQGVGQYFSEMMAVQGTPELQTQLRDVLNSSVGVGALIFGMVTALFIMAALLAMAGGALGAKILEKE